MKTKLEVGKTYKLPHGQGVLLGKQTFNKKGFANPLSTDLSNLTDSTRIIFRLLPGHTWCPEFNSECYCAWGRQIQPLEGSDETS